MPYQGRDNATTSAMPSVVKENVAQALLAPSFDPIQRKWLDRDVYMKPQLRAKEMTDTRSSCGLSRKYLAKDKQKEKVGTGSISQKDLAKDKQKEKVDTGSISGKHLAKDKKKEKADTGSISRNHLANNKQNEKVDTGSISQKHLAKDKQKEKVDTGSISQKHLANEKMCTHGPVNRTEARVAREKKKQHTGSNNANEKRRHPDQLRQHLPGIHGPVSVTKSPVAREKNQQTKNNSANEKMCPPDMLRQRTLGIQGPLSITEPRVAGEKKQHARRNTSFPKERSTPQLKTRTSFRCSNGTASRPVDPHDCGGNTAEDLDQIRSAAKLFKDMDDIIQKLNELGLGEDISFEEYYGYLTQLPQHPSVDDLIELSATECHDMEIRHAVYRIRSYKLSHNLSKNELCCNELKDCPMDLLDKEEFPSDFLVKMNFFRFFQREGVLDWSFHPKLCEPAGLTDYQRLVPRNHWLAPQNHFDYGFYEYANWEEYMIFAHTYEMEHEYIEYFESLLRELKWLKHCLPITRTSSPIADRICTRGLYQATKIAARFSKITSHLAFSGFYECFNYMSIEATWYDGSDGLFFEIWKRVALEKERLTDAVKEVYKLNKFLSRQDFLKYVVEKDDLIILEKGFQTCMRGIPDNVSEDEARELIAEAVKKQSVKPKFYREYIRKKMDIAESIGLICTREMPQKEREKVGTGSKEKMCPPEHMRGVSMTESRVAGEKKKQQASSGSNTSLPTRRATPQLRTRTSSSRCSNASASRPAVDPHDRGKAAAAGQQEQRQSAADKLDKDIENVIQKLNELGLGEDISFEDYYGYLTLLPEPHSVSTRIKLSARDCYDMEIRHAVYRIRSYKLLYNVSKHELCSDELEECDMDLLDKEEFPSDFLVKMIFFRFFQYVGVLHWSFHPELCKIDGLTDYQRLVPRNHLLVDHCNWNVSEYANWEEYWRYFHTYEMEHEYIVYFETLLRELQWLKNCLPITRTSSIIAGKICTRGIYQATKIATRFANITSYFTRFGFYECFRYMTIEATWCDEANGLFFEIWKRVVQEKENLRDAVKEVYKLNKFLSRQDFLKYVVEEDDLIILEKGFQTCMRSIADNVSEDEARELITEAVKNQRVKPKFYHEYIIKKIDIARSLGLITTE